MPPQLLRSWGHKYPKFLGRQVWPNSVDPDQTAEGASDCEIQIYTACFSFSIFLTHYSMVTPHCSNFRIITAFFLGCPNFFWFLWQTYSFSSFRSFVESFVEQHYVSGSLKFVSAISGNTELDYVPLLKGVVPFLVLITIGDLGRPTKVVCLLIICSQFKSVTCTISSGILHS